MVRGFNILHLFLLCLATLLFGTITPLNRLQAQERLSFRNISITEGLSQSTVYDIAQERHGRLWVATADGLNSYDSYTFKVFRHDIKSAKSLPDNSVRTLHFDPQQTLWVGTMNGLARYNINTSRFDTFTPDSSLKCQVMDIEQVDEREIVLATSLGLLLFDTHSEIFRPVANSQSLNVTTLSTVTNNILVGTHRGLYLYTPSSHSITPIVPQLSSVNINCIEIIPNQGIGIGTEGLGLFVLDDKFHVLKNFRGQKGELSSDFVRALRVDAEHRLWIGTFNGLDIYDADHNTFDGYHHDMNTPTTISQNSIRSIFMDNQGGMWLGSYFSGLDYYHRLQNRFSLIRQSASSNSLSDRVISCIVEDPRTKDLWIGTNDSGLDRYDRHRGLFTHFRRDQLGSSNVKCVMPYGPSQTYVGTHEGGMIIIQGQIIRTFTTSNSALSCNNVYSMLPSNDGSATIWVGTLEGLQIFNPQTNRFESHPAIEIVPELAHISILTMIHSGTNGSWIGTNSGLYRVSVETDGSNLANRTEQASIIVERYTSHDGSEFKQYIQALHQDSHGNLWVGTRTGLYRIDGRSSALTTYTTHNGLPNNVIYGIEQDKLDNLWISTNGGLTSFNPQQGTMRTYTESDGLQSNQFNNYSSCTSSDGYMFFGGINGITYFKPERLQDNPFTPAPIVGALSLFDREITPGDMSKILDGPIGPQSKISLKSDQNFFTLHLAVINFLSGGKNLFRYKLDGLDTKWYTSSRRDVSYSNLAPGRYTFMAEAANNDGKWSPTQTSVQIDILPTWYQTLLAKLLFLIIFGLIVYTAVNFFLAKIKIRRNEEINQMKVRFFINLTHELRTPLTLVIAPLQEILQRGVADKWTHSQLGYIQRSANRLLQLVNQMLDYRRAELGVFELRVAMVSAGTLAQDIFLLFDKTAKKRDIEYEFISEIDSRKYPIDINYLERILLNLLSNSFKFTPNGGHISLRIYEREGMLSFEVSDTGCGIAKSEQQRIFERFYHLYKDHMCSGIGLSLVKLLVEYHHGKIEIDSELGHGAKFTVSLSRNISSYGEKEWNRNAHSESIADLPLELMEVADTYPCAMHEPCQTPSPMVEGRETLLIVDDDDQIVSYLHSGFEQDYNLLTASNGEQALTLMRRNNVDLVITDVMMPVMDGLKLCRNIKQNIKTSHILVIMLTAKIGVEDQIGGLRCGADDYLAKPFVLPILRTKVANLLKIRRRLQRHYASNLEINPGQITFNAMDEELLQRCMSIVESNLENSDFSIDELSRQMGMSRSNLHLKLKAITGESAIEFIRKIKYKHACNMLVEGRYTVAEISSQLGFSTPSYFASSFKKYIGCLPTEYVKSGMKRQI